GDRVVERAYDYFKPRRHFLDEDTVDARLGLEPSYGREDVARRSFQSRKVNYARSDGSGLGFMRQVGRFDLDRERERQRWARERRDRCGGQQHFVHHWNAVLPEYLLRTVLAERSRCLRQFELLFRDEPRCHVPPALFERAPFLGEF